MCTGNTWSPSGGGVKGLIGSTARHQIAHDQPRDLVDESVAVAVRRLGPVDDELMGQGFDGGHQMEVAESRSRTEISLRRSSR